MGHENLELCDADRFVRKWRWPASFYGMWDICKQVSPTKPHLHIWCMTLDWLVEDHARMGMTTSCCISSTSEQLLAAVARRPKWPHAHYNLREFIGTRIPTTSHFTLSNLRIICADFIIDAINHASLERTFLSEEYQSCDKKIILQDLKRAKSVYLLMRSCRNVNLCLVNSSKFNSRKITFLLIHAGVQSLDEFPLERIERIKLPHPPCPKHCCSHAKYVMASNA